MERELILKFFSTRAIAADIHLIEFVRATKRFFDIAALSGDIVAQGEKEPSGFADLEVLLGSGLPAWKDQLTIVFGDGDSLSGRIDLLGLRKKRRGSASLGELALYRSHEFTIEIGHKLRNDEALMRRLFAYFCEVSSLLCAEYALCHENDGFLASLTQSKGLEAGLPGLFRMNAFGAAFTTLIGLEKLFSLPVFKRESLPERGFSIQMDGGLHRDSTPEMQAHRESVRDQIGREFFVDPRPADLALGSGEVGLWTFFSAVVRSKRDYESPKRLAARRPEIDWSGLFEK